MRRDQQIEYLEDVAEIMRRELGVRARWNTPNTWSNRSLFANEEVLRKSRADYEKKRLETAEDPWGDSEPETDHEVRKKRRRKEKKRQEEHSQSSPIASSEAGAATTRALKQRGIEVSLPAYLPVSLSST